MSTSADAPAAGGPTIDVRACPLCASTRSRVQFEDGPYSLCRCEACGLGWVSPRLDERGLAELYAAEGYWRSSSPKEVGYADYRSEEHLYLKTFRRRLGYALRSGPSGGRALDVGCAAGFCMSVLRERGFDVQGVEPSPAIAAHARERLGPAAVHVGTLETCPFERGSFDLVTMWDVVEHVVEPAALVEQAREMLAPGGLLVLETQNIDSAFARLLGRRWHHYKHAEHIQHFTPATIRALLGDCGLRVEHTTARFAGKYVSPHFIAERAGRLHPRLSTLLAPLARVQSTGLYVNVMDELIVLARRPPERTRGHGRAAADL